MKKSVFCIACILFITSMPSIAQSWLKGSISGEGDVVKKEINLSSFSGIDLNFSGEVVLTPGKSQKVVVEAQQNIIDNIKTEVKNGTWSISYIQNVKNAKPVKVYITLPDVKSIGLSGSGSIRSDGKFSGLGSLDVAVSGSGDIIFDYDSKDTDVAISGSGRIQLSGSTGKMNIAISGSGDVLATKLQSTGCDVSISGSGDASIHVNGELQTNIAGSGDVKYTGNASVTARISGSGTVSKM